MTSCEVIHDIAGRPVYGSEQGVCRITGKESTGINFDQWVKKTFTDHGVLHPGTIISNAARFTFEDASTLIQEKTGRDKPQKFRTYSHVVTKDGLWLCLTKRDKSEIVNILQANPKIVCLTDSGQKHLLFKNTPGVWQLDESHIMPDLTLFNHLHGEMMRLIELGFSQTEVKSGKYKSSRILKAGVSRWKEIEDDLKRHRGTPMFDFAAWLMYSIKIQ